MEAAESGSNPTQQMKRDISDVKYDTPGFWTFLNLHTPECSQYGTRKEKGQFGYHCKVRVLDLFNYVERRHYVSGRFNISKGIVDKTRLFVEMRGGYGHFWVRIHFTIFMHYFPQSKGRI